MPGRDRVKRKSHKGEIRYPIEINLPDIAPYSEGNCGIPYVFSFDSGLAGPHVMINSLTHGNEVCGAIVVKALLDHGIRPNCGRLTLAFANVDAYQRFDVDAPDASRYLEQDFNRLWSSTLLDDTSRNSLELRRARAMRPVFDTVDFLLDLHSMHERSEPLILSGPLDKGVELARAIGAPSTIVSDYGHTEGRRLRDYSDFAEIASEKNALLVECGQHWEAEAVSIAQDCTARFLTRTGVLETDDLPVGWLRPDRGKSCIIRVTDAVVATSMDFQFAGTYTGLETFAEAGTVVAWSNGEAIATPYPNCILVMPSLRQLRPGVTVVRFGQQID